MKKVFKLYILLFVLSFIGVINVNAAPSLSFDSGTITISSAESKDINLYLNTDGNNIRQVMFNVSTSTPEIIPQITVLGISPVIGTQTQSKVVLSSTTNMNDGSAIATLTIRNNGTANQKTGSQVILTNIEFLDDNNNTISGSYNPKNITLSATTTTTTTPLSSNSQISSLTFNNGATTSVAWNPNTKNYKVFVKDTIKNLTMTINCDGCKQTITCVVCSNYTNQNRLELEIGKNQVTINTTSAKGDTSDTYYLTIYRGATSDNSSFLKALKVDGFTINEEFNKNTVDYTISVPYDAETLYIMATPEDSLAKVEIKGADNLIVGENVITITVTSSESGDKKIYNLTVTRLEEGEEVSTTPVVTPEETPKKNSKWVLILVISLAGLGIIGFAAYAIFGKKKKKNNKKGKAEAITDEGKIEKEELLNDDITVHENELKDELNITDEKVKPTVEEALVDLMITKEIVMEEEHKLMGEE